MLAQQELTHVRLRCRGDVWFLHGSVREDFLPEVRRTFSRVVRVTTSSVSGGLMVIDTSTNASHTADSVDQKRSAVEVFLSVAD